MPISRITWTGPRLILCAYRTTRAHLGIPHQRPTRVCVRARASRQQLQMHGTTRFEASVRRCPSMVRGRPTRQHVHGLARFEEVVRGVMSLRRKRMIRPHHVVHLPSIKEELIQMYGNNREEECHSHLPPPPPSPASFISVTEEEEEEEKEKEKEKQEESSQVFPSQLYRHLLFPPPLLSSRPDL